MNPENNVAYIMENKSNSANTKMVYGTVVYKGQHK